MICNHCGRQIGDHLKQCPECGMPTQNFYVPTYSYRDESQGYQRSSSGNQVSYINKKNGLAGMILGILAITGGVFGGIVAIFGIVVSIVALCKKGQPKNFATVGLILSIVAIPVCVAYSFFYFYVIWPMAMNMIETGTSMMNGSYYYY